MKKRRERKWQYNEGGGENGGTYEFAATSAWRRLFALLRSWRRSWEERRCQTRPMEWMEQRRCRRTSPMPFLATHPRWFLEINVWFLIAWPNSNFSLCCKTKVSKAYLCSRPWLVAAHCRRQMVSQFFWPPLPAFVAAPPSKLSRPTKSRQQLPIYRLIFPAFIDI